MSFPSQATSAPFTPSGNAEQDWMNMLMASPLFHQINDIQDLLDKNLSSATGGKGDLILGNTSYYRAYALLRYIG